MKKGALLFILLGLLGLASASDNLVVKINDANFIENKIHVNYTIFSTEKEASVSLLLLDLNKRIVEESFSNINIDYKSEFEFDFENSRFLDNSYIIRVEAKSNSSFANDEREIYISGVSGTGSVIGGGNGNKIYLVFLMFFTMAIFFVIKKIYSLNEARKDKEISELRKGFIKMIPRKDIY
jgi:hypothetical protein